MYFSRWFFVVAIALGLCASAQAGEPDLMKFYGDGKPTIIVRNAGKDKDRLDGNMTKAVVLILKHAGWKRDTRSLEEMLRENAGEGDEVPWCEVDTTLSDSFVEASCLVEVGSPLIKISVLAGVFNSVTPRIDWESIPRKLTELLADTKRAQAALASQK